MLTARYRRIVYFFARLLVSFTIWDVLLPRLGLRRWSQRSRSMRLSRAAARVRRSERERGGHPRRPRLGRSTSQRMNETRRRAKK